MPLGLSAIAKKDFRSKPSTLTARLIWPFSSMAPGLNVALIPSRSSPKGLVLGLKSTRHDNGTWSGVMIG